jgi:AAA ATPase containing von Willebrand factor type A (vWA) domain
MDNTSKNTENTSGGSNGDIPRKFNISGGEDLPDNPQDKDKLKSETTIIDLPDVKDIPGQEFIHPAPLGEMSDTTIASDDEEGVGIFDEEEDDSLNSDTSSNVTMQEKIDLQQTSENMPTKDDQSIVDATMDNEDENGEPLNEEGFGEDVSGDDLDVPGTEADDANEEIGEEDEENNVYSASDENNDNVSQGDS